MVGATAVVATIMAGAEAEATTMVGGTIVIGNLICRSEEAASVGGLFRFGHILRQAVWYSPVSALGSGLI
jgi:hypothetical protein